jgi:hypothetical protein
MIECDRVFSRAGRRMSVDVGGGRYEVGPEALAALLSRWRMLRTQLDADRAHGVELLKTATAGDEPASKTMVNLIHLSGEEFIKHNQALGDYVDSHIAALEAAHASYVNGEEAAVHAMRRQTR